MNNALQYFLNLDANARAVAACVADHGGNWLESRMCHLGGQFAGVLRVEVDAGQRDGLVRTLPSHLVCRRVLQSFHPKLEHLDAIVHNGVLRDHPRILYYVLHANLLQPILRFLQLLVSHR